MSNKFAVSPMSQKIELKAGETYTGSITIANPKAATEDFHYQISLSPYSVIGENYTPDFTTMSDWSRIVDWMSIDSTEGALKPNETKEIHFTIQVPVDAPAGGQYAMIGVSSNNPVEGAENGVVQNVFEMASIVYASIDGTTVHEGEVLDNTVTGFVAVGKPITTATVTNHGNVHETLTTNLTVKNVFNGQVIMATDESEEKLETTIMPNSTRTITRELSNIPALGIFEVKQQLSYLGQTSEVSTVMVVCPIWFIALVIATICSIIGMIFYGKHLKKKRANKSEEEKTE